MVVSAQALTTTHFSGEVEYLMSSVQSVERAFAVLRVLATGATGVTEIAERVALPKSTVSRLLSTLETIGAVEQVSVGGRYRIGAALDDLTTAGRRGHDLVDLARPHLVELRDALGESAGISVLEGDTVVYLAQADSENPVMVRDWTGDALPWHVVSSGFVLVAALTESERDTLLGRRRQRLTARTVTDSPELRRRLDATIDSGHSWTLEEYVEGIASVAAPVRDRDGAVVAALHAHGPAYRFPRPGDEQLIAGTVVAAADRLTTAMTT